MTFDWLGLLRSETDRFASLIDGADLSVPLTFCPGWTLGDLTVHLAGVYRWAAHAVVEGDPHLQPAPIEPADPGVRAWYRRQAAHLTEALAATPADAPVWTFDDHDSTAGFWRRRQVHETVIHLWDAQHALGELEPIDPALAWDGVLEVKDILYPRQLRLGRVEPLAPAVRLVATDVGADMTIGDGEAVVIREDAEVLVRLLWHRVDPERELTEPRAAALLANALTP